jgi:transcriptional regulator with XRE-family HTH domain
LFDNPEGLWYAFIEKSEEFKASRQAELKGRDTMERAQVSTGRNELLIAAREALGSQETVAARIGVDRMTIHRWEQSLSFPQPRHLRKLCQVTGKTAVALGFAEEAPAEVEAPTAEESTEVEYTTKSEDMKQAEGPKDLELPIGKEYQDFRESSLVLRLFLCVKNSPRSSKARYHELQRLMALELRDNKMDTNELSRREALKFVAAMPVEYCGLSTLRPVLKESHDEILLQCGAGITACWGLRKTPDITFAAQTAAKYIPTLKEITVIGSSQQRREAAELLFQCFLLLATHSYVVMIGAPNAVAYGKQAKLYADMAENPLLQIAALRSQSVAYEYIGDWKLALNTGLKAKRLLETTKNMPIPLLLDSWVRAGLSNYQAFFGRKDDAEALLRQARAAFEAQARGESAPIWIDHSIGTLILLDGKTQMHLGLYKDAIDLFEQVDSDYANDTSTSFATRIEVGINQIIAELSRKDQAPNMDWCITNWQKSLNDARALQSTRKENRAIEAYAAMLRVWPEEKDVIELGQEHLM